MAGIAAIAVDPQKSGIGTKLFGAGFTDITAAAPAPWIDHIGLGRINRLAIRPHCIRPYGRNDTGHLMPRNHRQFHPAFGIAEPTPVAQIKAALTDMQVGVANARRRDADDNFGSLRDHVGAIFAIKRLAEYT